MIQNILVYGLGGVGGYFGSMLARGAAGRHITFIARGKHLEAIKSEGLYLDTDEVKDIHCKPGLAAENPGDAPPPDLCIVAVKGYDLDQVSRELAGHLSDGTLVLPLLNGVDIRERMRRHLHTGVILPACVYVSGNITAAGRVTQRGPAGSIIAGKDPDHPGRSIEEVEALFSEAGIPFSVPEDPYPAIWQKFLFIASYGLVTAFSRKNFGELLSDPHLVERTALIAAEAAAVGRKRGVALPEDAEKTALNAGKKFPPETRTSFQRDVEAGKPRNEGDLFGGTIIRLGKELGIPTPVTEEVYGKI